MLSFYVPYSRKTVISISTDRLEKTVKKEKLKKISEPLLVHCEDKITVLQLHH